MWVSGKVLLSSPCLGVLHPDGVDTAPPMGQLEWSRWARHACPAENSQDGRVAFVTLGTGSLSLAFILFLYKARLKGPLAKCPCDLSNRCAVRGLNGD